MDDFLFTIEQPDNLQHAKQALPALEAGKIIYFPTHAMQLSAEEQPLLSNTILHPKHKNISYDITKQRIAGISHTDVSNRLQPFMHRYAIYARQLIDTLCPEYSHDLQWGRTSYRPAEIKNRPTSKRKDDTRLHVDSFSATPVNGLRILRVFCNINPNHQPRVWHVGEPFANVLQQFAPKIPTYNKAHAKLLKFIKTTKTLRSAYDHYMLHLHDQMKLDDNYQQTVTKQRIAFPSQSTWIVFTDHVSHAALSGQYLLEQTFYIPVNAMAKPEHSPLKQWATLRDIN